MDTFSGVAKSKDRKGKVMLRLGPELHKRFAELCEEKMLSERQADLVYGLIGVAMIAAIAAWVISFSVRSAMAKRDKDIAKRR